MEFAVIAGGSFAIMGAVGALMFWYYRRDRVRLEAQIAAWRKERPAIPAAARPAVAAPAVTVTHHHYDERQVTVVSNDNRQLHVHQAAPAAVEPAAVEAEPLRRALAPRVVPGVVVSRRKSERIRR